MSKTVVLLPVYNEETALEDVLRRVIRHADFVVCVNDASTDGSAAILRRIARNRRNVHVLDLSANAGMAQALKAGFVYILSLVRRGTLKVSDVVVTMDADGQHEPDYIPKALKHLEQGGFDVALLRRDLGNYPLYKRWGNAFLSFINSRLAGVRYRDVECGFRLMKIGVLPSILAYYTGVKYSCAQEIALLTARQGFRVDNSFEIRIPFYRRGATFLDGFIVLALSLYTYLRWRWRLPVEKTADSARPAGRTTGTRPTGSEGPWT